MSSLIVNNYIRYINNINKFVLMISIELDFNKTNIDINKTNNIHY